MNWYRIPTVLCVYAENEVSAVMKAAESVIESDDFFMDDCDPPQLVEDETSLIRMQIEREG